MYNILCSKIEALPQHNQKISKFFNENQKVLIIPWSFAKESI